MLWNYQGTVQGIQLTQLTGSNPEIDICHSGQAKRRAGISSFLARARVWEIPVFPCGETGMTVLVQACAELWRTGRKDATMLS